MHQSVLSRLRPHRTALVLMAVAMMLVATVFQAPQRAEAAIPPPATLTQTFYGTLISKIGPTNQGVTRPVVVTVKSVASVNSFGGFNGNITEVKVVSASQVPGNGDIRVNTTTAGWTRTPGNTSRFVLTTPSDAASQVYINGAWRQLKRTTGKDTVVATFAEGGSRLRLNISGQAATGSGSTITAVEISNLTTGLDAMPLVVSSIPASGALVSTSATPSFIFSEPVTVPSNAFALTCDNVAVPFVLSGSGTTTLKLTPSSVLPEGQTCRATVDAALAADVDTLDEPNLGTGSESFTFVTDVRPSVVDYSPTADGRHPSNANPQVTFSEPVSLATGAITMMCGEGDTQIPVIVTMNTARTIATVKPLSNLPGDSSCRVTVKGNLVTDLDTADAPDQMTGDHGYSFMTDAAPYVVNIENGSNEGVIANTPPPSSGPQTHWAFPFDVATDEEFGIFFSELVTLDSGAITVTCNGFPQVIALDSGIGNGVWVVAPSTAWPAGTYCTGTITSTKVHDTDTIDPLDVMAANVTFSFQIDAAPYVVSSNPSNNGGYFPGTPISVTFSEPVSVSEATLICFGNSYPLGAHPSVSQDGKTWTWTGEITNVLEGQNGQVEGPQTCTFTIAALNVEDNDSLDPPSTMANPFVLNLNVEQAPWVSSINISPMFGETVGPNPSFVVTFSEKVNITNPSHAFTLTCDGEPYSLSGGTVSNKTSATVTASNIGGPECTFTVVAEYVSDADAIDPPDHPYNDEIVTFSTDQAPFVVSTTPESGDVMPDSGNPEQPWGILLGWSEPVVMGEGSFAIVCGPSNTAIPSDFTDLGEDSDTGEYAVAIYTESDLAAYQGQTCTISVTGANVDDVDAADPPDHAENSSYTFTIDSPPSVTSVDVLGDSDTSEGSLSESSSTIVSTGARFRVNFSEPVDVLSDAFSLTCDGSYSIDFEVVDSLQDLSEEVTSIIITMSSDSVDGAAGLDCTMELSDDPDGVVDSDIYDTPNDIDRAYSWDFTFDEAPELLEGSTIDANGVISLTFSEPVDVDLGMDITFYCNAVPVDGFSIGGDAAPYLTWTFTPTPAPGPGSLCTLTVPATNITDRDTIDAPDNPAADVEVTLSIDAAPAVVLANSSVSAQYQAVGDSDTIEIAFSEEVFVDGNGISATCDGEPVEVGVGQNIPDTAEITPANDLPWGPEGAHCELTIDKDVVTDRDEVDPPDVMEEDFVLSFVVGADAAPSLVSWTFTSVDHLQLTFSEGVWLGYVFPAPMSTAICDSSQQNYSISFTPDPKVWVVFIQTGITPGAVCQFTHSKDNVADNDLFDGPNNPIADIVIDFTVDAAPEVVSAQSSPSADGLTVAENKPVTIMFSEEVDADSDSFEVVCETVSIAVTVTADLAGEEYTIAPNTSWGSVGDDCTLTVVANQVTDADTNDAPDTMAEDFVRTFIVGDTDNPPALVDYTSVDGFGAYSLEFSEAVDIAAEADDSALNCGLVIGTVVGALSTTDDITWTFTPDSPVEAGAECNFLIPASLVTDRDGYADELTEDVDIDFSIDEAPALTSTTLSFEGSTIGVNDTIYVSFTELVTLGTNAFSITCDSNGVSIFVSDTGTLADYRIDPSTSFPEGTACTLTVDYTKVTDNDTDDGPDTMVEDAVLSFSVAGALPEVTSLSQTGGPSTGGNSVVVTGVNFTGATDVSFGSTTATAFTVDSDTQITATAPAGIPGTVDVTVTTSAGTSVTSASDEYTYYDAPNIVLVNPAAGTTSGNESVSIHGTDFSSATSVTFDGIEVSFTVVSDSSITAMTPAGSPGAVDVVVTTLGGSATAVGGFTYDEAPSVVLASSTPNAQNASIGGSDTIEIAFSEAVTLGAAIDIVCDSTPVTGATVTSSNGIMYTITPDTIWGVDGASCTLTVDATEVSDSDINDGPDEMDADFVLNFTIDDGPLLLSSTPSEGGSVSEEQSVTIALTFDQNVSWEGGDVELTCTVGGSIMLQVSVTNHILILAYPDQYWDIGGGLRGTCSFTLGASLVVDTDGTPTEMTTDLSLSFLVLAAA